MNVMFNNLEVNGASVMKILDVPSLLVKIICIFVPPLLVKNSILVLILNHF